MGRFRKQHGTDLNQGEIVKALEKIGCRVYEIEKPVDLLVDHPAGLWILVEVKNKHGKNRLTPAQEKFFEAGPRGPTVIVRDAVEAIEQVQQAARDQSRRRIGRSYDECHPGQRQ